MTLFIQDSPTLDDLAPYAKFCECGPDFNRSVAESASEARRWIQAGNAKYARFWTLKTMLHAKDLTLEAFNAEVSTL